ncbi:MAG: DNA polymerase III subunit delta, partial [Desulfamplus sp.]|nr:DNA polymerase III subunit delta [Desulfamplus sp.]
MAEIKQNGLASYLNSLTSDNLSTTYDSINSNKIPSIFFIWGEEFLCRKVFDAVIAFLLPDNLKELCYELLEGEDAVIPSIMERISTYSFFQEKKVVAIKNAPIFSPPGTSAQPGFLSHDLENLQKLIEKGFPANHYLVITASNADKRRALFNTIKTSGLAIDCTVSQGSGKADKEEQAELLRLTMMEVLDRRGKGIDGDAFNALKEMTGFDPAALNDNLERLTSFIGDREKITIKDVYSVVKRSKKDPIFELTNAVAQKSLESSLFYYKSLCDNGFHPLQLLASIVNQIRKVFVVKSFIASEAQKGNICWSQGSRQNYQQFTTTTMPYITKTDMEIENTLKQWREELINKSDKNQSDEEHDDNSSGDDYESDSDNFNDDSKFNKSKKSSAKGAAKKNSVSKSSADKNSTDLIIASNPKSAYPVYQTFLKSDRFSINELAAIMAELSEADYRLKSSSDG